MAERKSGPVKPPVIDLKAREATEPAPSEQPETPMPVASETASPTPEPAPPEPAARPKPAPKAAAKVAPAPAVAESEPTPAAEPRPAPEPEPKPAPKAAEPLLPRPAPELPPPPPPPRPQARLAMPWSAISIAAGGGAVLGAILTYILANWIALPDKGPAFSDPAPALASLGDRAATIEQKLGALEESGLDTRLSVDQALVQFDSAVSELRQSIAEVSASIPAAQTPVDLTEIDTQLQALADRVDAIAAGASSADAAALAERLAGMEEVVATLNTQIADLTGRVTADDGTIAQITTDIDALKAAIAAQNLSLGGTEIGPAVKLPLILSGLESAFAQGRSYEVELQSLLAVLPDLNVPPAVAANASTGLARPDALARRFDAAVPDILAGRTGASTGDWARDAVEWAKAILAMRPAEEIEGDTPEAIVSRLEGAVDRHDFTTAAVLLAQLPEPMRLAAGEIGEAIAAHADAEGFVAELRAQALTSALEGGN